MTIWIFSGWEREGARHSEKGNTGSLCDFVSFIPKFLHKRPAGYRTGHPSSFICHYYVCKCASILYPTQRPYNICPLLLFPPLCCLYTCTRVYKNLCKICLKNTTESWETTEPQEKCRIFSYWLSKWFIFRNWTAEYRMFFFSISLSKLLIVKLFRSVKFMQPINRRTCLKKKKQSLVSKTMKLTTRG